MCSRWLDWKTRTISSRRSCPALAYRSWTTRRSCPAFTSKTARRLEVPPMSAARIMRAERPGALTNSPGRRPTSRTPWRGRPGACRTRDRSDLLVLAAPHLVHVRTFDPDEACGSLAPRGVKVSLVVDVRHARLECVARREANLPWRVVGGRRHHRPVAHHGLAPGLPVDRPGWAVIVRLTLLGACVVVRQDAEAEHRIFVEDLALRHLVSDV